ncbi:MAG: ABC transporter ATP-binding protein [Eubacteriales bacterium]|nr:ABC transporter ATP-binding protein [Eubacteriales bacterium]
MSFIPAYLRSLRWFLHPEAKRFRLYFLIALIELPITVQLPRLIGVIADQLSRGEGEQTSFLLNITGCFLLIVISYTLMNLLCRTQGLFGIFIRRRALSRLYRHTLAQRRVFFDEFSDGEILTRASSDVDNLQEAMGYGLICVVDATLYPATIFISLAMTVGIGLAATIVLPIVPVIFLGFLMNRFWDRSFHAQQEAYENLSDEVLEGIQGIRVVRAYHVEARKNTQFAEAVIDLRKKKFIYRIWAVCFWPFCSMLLLISYIALFLIGLPMMNQGLLSVGQMTSALFYIASLQWPAVCLSDALLVAKKALESMNRIDEVLNYKDPEIEGDTKALTEGIHRLRFRDFHFSYPRHLSEIERKQHSEENRQTTTVERLQTNCSKEAEAAFALEGINFELRTGQTIAVVGPVGSGKSTLLQQLLRLYPMDNEGIEINGEAIQHFEPNSLRSHIAYVPQNSFLFSDSIQNNIFFSDGLRFGDEEVRPEQQKRLEEVFTIADLEEDLEQFPDSYRTQTGERGISLSGGQKQRISLARALYKQGAELLILDDCLSAVDGSTEARILEQLKQINEGRLMMVAAHRFSAVLNADEILVLDHGRIVDRGRHAELADRPGWYQDQCKIQGLL